MLFLRPIRSLLLAAAWCALFTLTPRAMANAQSSVEALIRTGDIGSAVCSVYVLNLNSNEVVVQRFGNRPMIPASNMKLVTTAAAIKVLGPEFQFSTKLLQQGDDLVVVGDGDPGFGDPKLLAELGLNHVVGNGHVNHKGSELGLEVEHLLARWVAVVKDADISRINTLYVDDRQFDRQFVHPAWPKEQLHLWYCAQVAGLNFNDNCLDVYATPGKRAGDTPVITTRPLDAPVNLTNLARTGKRNALWLSREQGTNRITLRGTIPHRLVSPIHVTVHDPPMFFGHTFRDRLLVSGVDVKQVARVNTQVELQDTRILAEVRTPLRNVLARCNKQSQNLFAEALLKRVGRHATGEPGSWTSGAAATRMFLSRALGPDARDITIDDGSGLSRNNQVTTRLLVRLLNHMHRDPRMAQMYKQSLAHGGKEGTLAKRFRSAKFKDVVIQAKSGRLRDVLALSGYLTRGDDTLAFSIILNNFKKSGSQGKRLVDAILATLVEDMERAEAR